MNQAIKSLVIVGLWDRDSAVSHDTAIPEGLTI